MSFTVLLFFVVAGTVLASFLSLIPALHVYNVAGLLIVLTVKFGDIIPKEYFPYFMMAMIVAYSILNTIPSLFLGAPDESAVFVVLPGQKYMMLGKGFEASMLTGVGALGGIIMLVLATPVIKWLLPSVRKVVQPHMFWVLGVIITYILMSEWPKGTDRAKTSIGRFLDAWSSLFAGMATFFLSGLMGIILLSKNLMPLDNAFQGMMPVFVGLFAVPWIITNIMSKNDVPAQYISESIDLPPVLGLRGVIAGFLGGFFAASFPLITAGIGGVLAGHATAQRDDRIFVISQGTSKTIYYVGAFLFLFMPGLNITRGGLAIMTSPIFQAKTVWEYVAALATILISGGIAFFLLIWLSKLIIKVIERYNYRYISLVTGIVLLFMVWQMTGLIGLFIMTVATAIGLIPVLYHSRRLNCMGFLLVPVTLNMAGLGPKVINILGLM